MLKEKCTLYKRSQICQQKDAWGIPVSDNQLPQELGKYHFREGGGILFLDQFIGPLSFSLSLPSFIVVFFLQMSSVGTGRIFWYMHLRTAGDGGEWAQGCGSSDGPHSSQAPRPAGPSPHLHSPRPRRPPADGSAACRRRLRPGRLAWCAAVPV